MTRLIAGLALILVALAACASPQIVGVDAPMELRTDEEDPILPVRIMHNSERIWNGDTLEQDYNYLIYEFETEQHLYRARAYLHDIQTVAIFGPFDKASQNPTPLADVEIDQRVLAYLRRRYVVIMTLGPTGYVPIE